MALTPPQTSHGTTIAFGTGGPALGNIVDLQINGPSREEIETTHFGTTGNSTDMGGRTFIMPELADPGEFTAEVQFDPDVTYGMELHDMTAAPSAVTITWRGSGGTTWVTDAECKSISVSAPIANEDIMKATIVFKMSGDIDATP